jgi:predicted SAM-dependent methyltransferase
LEIGAGKSKKEGFFSLDLDFTSDFPFDLRVGMPFSDNSIDFIYAEHVLEHFQYEEVMLVLLECKRVMRNGGVFKISVPDARIYLKGYSCPGNFNTKKFCTFDAGLDLDVAINIVNYMCYMSGHHRFMFDEDSLAQILRSVGFSNVGIREFDAELDQLSRRHESIYAQCVKL